MVPRCRPIRRKVPTSRPGAKLPKSDLAARGTRRGCLVARRAHIVRGRDCRRETKRSLGAVGTESNTARKLSARRLDRLADEDEIRFVKSNGSVRGVGRRGQTPIGREGRAVAFAIVNVSKGLAPILVSIEDAYAVFSSQRGCEVPPVRRECQKIDDVREVVVDSPDHGARRAVEQIDYSSAINPLGPAPGGHGR